MLNRIKIADNFWLDEFQCVCCQTVKLEPELLENLQKLRDKMGFPFVLNSGYRCVEYNRRIGGVPNSFHTQGKAVDVSMRGHSKEVVLKVGLIAQELGFKGIGYYYSKRDGSAIFIHLDIGTSYFRQWERVI